MARILIVDDTDISREMLRWTLSNAGYEIAGEAANGQEAIAMYAALKPDLVTMDVTMPVLDGISALKKIIASDPKARVIMVTSADAPFESVPFPVSSKVAGA